VVTSEPTKVSPSDDLGDKHAFVLVCDTDTSIHCPLEELIEVPGYVERLEIVLGSLQWLFAEFIEYFRVDYLRRGETSITTDLTERLRRVVRN